MVAVAGRSWISGLVVAGLALAVQAAYLTGGRNDPTFTVPIIDAATYHEAAVRFAEGGPLASGAFWQPPLFPLLLGCLYYLTGPSLLAAKIALAFLACLSCFAVWWLGTRLFSRTVGILAGVILAFYGPFVFYSTQLLPAGLVIFLIVTSFCLWLGCLEKPRWHRWLLLGWNVGAAIITVPNAAVLFPVFLLATAFAYGRSEARRKMAWGSLLMTLGIGLIILSVAARNYAASGLWVPISTNGGINLYVGNNAHSEETVALRPGEPWNRLIRQSVAAGAANHAEQNAYFTRLAKEYMLKQPGEFIAGLGKKARHLLAARELPRNVDPYVFREFYPVLRLLMFECGGWSLPWGIVCPLALAGIALFPGFPSQDRNRIQTSGRWALVGFLLAYSASVVLFFVSGRYRLPMVPILAIFAATALVRGTHLVRTLSFRRWTIWIIPLMVLLMSAFLVNQPVRAPTDGINFKAELFMCVGQAHATRGNLDAAEHWLRQSLIIDPHYSGGASALASVLAQRGRFEVAERLAQDACRFDELSPQARWTLADVLHRGGRLDEAETAFREALRLDAHSPFAHAGLAEVLLQRQDRTGAIEHYRSAVRFASQPGLWLVRLGQLLVENAEFQEAIGLYRRALRERALDVPTRNSIAWLLATCPKVELRDCKEAVRLAEGLCAETQYLHPILLDTLAAAYAGCGRMTDAIHLAKTAFDIANRDADPTLADSIRGRLRLYQERVKTQPGERVQEGK